MHNWKEGMEIIFYLVSESLIESMLKHFKMIHIMHYNA